MEQFEAKDSKEIKNCFNCKYNNSWCPTCTNYEQWEPIEETE